MGLTWGRRARFQARREREIAQRGGNSGRGRQRHRADGFGAPDAERARPFGPVQQLERAVVVLDERRAMLDPVAVVDVEHAVRFTDAGRSGCVRRYDRRNLRRAPRRRRAIRTRG